MTNVARDYRPLVKAARAAGWVLEMTRNNHWRLRSPDGEAIFFPLSPSDWRGWKNTRSRLRRAGVDC